MTTLRRILASALVLLLAGVSLPARSADSPASFDAVDLPDPACRSVPHLERRIAELVPAVTDCYGEADCWRPRVAALEALLDENPGDVELHRSYQQMVRRLQGNGADEARKAMRQRYEARARAHPEDPASHYLLGRLLGDDEQGEHFERALELDPDFPWAHFGRAASLRSSARDAEDSAAIEERALDHLLRFWQLCPTRADQVLPYSRTLGDAEVWRPRLPELRAALDQLPDRQQAATYPLLWGLAFRVTPPTEHDALRQRIRDDIEALEAIAFEQGDYGLYALKNGYETVGDEEALTALGDRLIREQPCSTLAVDFHRERSNQRHQARREAGETLSQEELRRAYEEAVQRTERCPEEFTFAGERFHHAKELEGMSDEQFLAEVDHYLEVWEANRWRYKMSITPWYQVVEALLERDLALERAPELMEQHMRQRGAWDRDSSIDDWPEAMQTGLRQGRITLRLRDLAKLFEVEMRLQRLDDADSTLALYEGYLEQLATLEDEKAERLERRHTPAERSRWWRLRGQLAEAREQPLDALAFYRQALQGSPDDAESAERAEALWRQLGGGEAGWQAFSSPDPEAEEELTEATRVSGWRVADEPLTFELVDVAGKTWSSEELLGKTVLFNLWATWCGPCRLEMPEIVELHDRLRERDDLLVLTLNVDENPGLIASFVEQHDMEMPVLLAFDFLQDKWQGATSIPRNWIVDPEGILRFEQSGYSPEASEGFVDRLLAKMEDAHRQAVAPPADDSSGR